MSKKVDNVAIHPNYVPSSDSTLLGLVNFLYTFAICPCLLCVCPAVISLLSLGRFLADLMDGPELIRNVTLCGHLHHGKVRAYSYFTQFLFKLQVFHQGFSVTFSQQGHVFLR